MISGNFENNQTFWLIGSFMTDHVLYKVMENR